MGKRILDVGNCDPDHLKIKGLLQRHFEAEVVREHNHDGALAELRRHPFDLVLINRLMDADGTSGLEIVKTITQDPQLKRIPVMLLTNFPEHQQAAMAVGAVQGFGKAALSEPATVELLRAHLLASLSPGNPNPTR